MTDTTQQFPVETIDLPSKGVFYPPDSPLRSGTIEVHYMTAKHEDILTSPNLIQKGIVLDKFIDAIIATKGVKAENLLLGDLNAVMIAARILGYGKDYPVTIACGACGEKNDHIINLAELGMEHQPEEDSTPELVITLPVSNAVLELKILTRGDELQIEKEVKGLKKVSPEIDMDATTRLKNIIKSVNGDTSKGTIWKFVDTMLVRDSKYLREQYRKMVPDIDFNINIECERCDNTSQVRLPIGLDFFWPDARV